MPNQYVDFPIDERGDLTQTVILKIHGAVDRNPPATWSSYLITEDHYIDYLSQSELSNLVPAALVSKMIESHFLFLGYSMRDWNLRVLLNRIWGEQPLSYKSWAVQLRPGASSTRSSGRSAASTSSTRRSTSTWPGSRRAWASGSRPRRASERRGRRAAGRAGRPRSSPYVGLQPYGEEDAVFFFGREAERKILSANLGASRLTVLYAESGVGKSSVLRAGVAAHLRRRRPERGRTRRAAHPPRRLR